MAVYTRLDRNDIEAFLKPYSLGKLLDYKGVADGIENTNYFVTVEHGIEPDSSNPQSYVLTIFESQQHDDLPFFVELTTLLYERGSPVPSPVRDRHGTAIQTVKSKPALLVPKLPGSHPETPTLKQCRAIGAELARIHQHTLNSKLQHESNRGLTWLSNTAAAIKPLLQDPTDQQLLQEPERFQRLCSEHPNALPQAVIHSDLFRDNALFVGEQLSGVIDFNSAGTGYLLFDLAVVVNDWSSRTDALDASFDMTLASAIVNAYRSIRPLNDTETLLWNDFLRVAAARFWISRLSGQLQVNDDTSPPNLTVTKNPLTYKNILLKRIKHPQILSR